MASLVSQSDGGVISSWPCRREKRSAAIARDMNKIEQRLKSLEEGMQSLVCKVEGFLSSSVALVDAYISTKGDGATLGKLRNPHIEKDDILELTSRISRMELLLLRTSLPDFELLDNSIAELLPRVTEVVTVPEEPEKEASPQKVCSLAPFDDSLWHQDDDKQSLIDPVVKPTCLRFDIFSDAGDSQVDRESHGDEELAEKAGCRHEIRVTSQAPATLYEISQILHVSHQELVQEVSHDVSSKLRDKLSVQT